MRIHAAIAAALVLAGGTALAGSMERVGPVTHQSTLKECGECHMAYQPALLPAASWELLMDGLSNHFGENLSLPDETAAAIRAYLTQGSGGGDGRLTRITEQRWWLREHGFDASVWQRPEIVTKGNCEACHRGAARGVYDDD